LATAFASLALVLCAACTRISVNPDCPEDLEVSDVVELHANAVNEGGIATFTWTVTPSTAGDFSDPDRPDTDFEALQAGTATIRLQASDGLFVDGAECRIQIGAGGVAVQLTFSPPTPETGDTVTLTCTSIGGVPVDEFTLEQDEGPTATLTPVSDGVATFSPTETGQYSFSCVGLDAEGVPSQPDSVDINVRGGRPPRG
jgi:hypothetical protein